MVEKSILMRGPQKTNLVGIHKEDKYHCSIEKLNEPKIYNNFWGMVKWANSSVILTTYFKCNWDLKSAWVWISNGQREGVLCMVHSLNGI